MRRRGNDSWIPRNGTHTVVNAGTSIVAGYCI